METTTKQHLADTIGDLSDPGKWEYNAKRRRYSASVSPYNLHVDDLPSGVTWQVEHEDFGVLMAWTPQNSVKEARAHAVDFARAHALGRYEPKHLED